MRLYFVLILLILFPSLSFAAFELRETDFSIERSSKEPKNVFESSKDPASLANSKDVLFSSFYTQIYSLKELTLMGTGFTFPNPLGSSSISNTQFGYSHYLERKIIFSHGFRFQENLSLGFNLKGISLEIQDYGSDSTVQWDSSLHVKLNPNLEFSTTLWNLNKASLSGGRENLPTGFTSVIQGEIFSKLNVSLELNRTNLEPFNLQTSLTYPLHNSFHIQAGFKDRPAQFIGGFRIKLHRILLDYHYLQNSNLPSFHQIIFTLRLGK